MKNLIISINQKTPRSKQLTDAWKLFQRLRGVEADKTLSSLVLKMYEGTIETLVKRVGCSMAHQPENQLIISINRWPRKLPLVSDLAPKTEKATKLWRGSRLVPSMKCLVYEIYSNSSINEDDIVI